MACGRARHWAYVRNWSGYLWLLCSAVCVCACVCAWVYVCEVKFISRTDGTQLEHSFSFGYTVVKLNVKVPHCLKLTWGIYSTGTHLSGMQTLPRYTSQIFTSFYNTERRLWNQHQSGEVTRGLENSLLSLPGLVVTLLASGLLVPLWLAYSCLVFIPMSVVP